MDELHHKIDNLVFSEDAGEIEPDRSLAQHHAMAEELCSNCKAVDLRELLLGQVAEGEQTQMRLGFVDDIISSSSCRLCQLVSKAIQQGWTDSPLWVRRSLLSGRERTEVVLQAIKATTSYDTLARSVGIHIVHDGRAIERATSEDGVAAAMFLPEMRLLAEDAPLLGTTVLGHGREIQKVCEIALMTEWYNKCVNEHTENCSRTRIVSEFKEKELLGLPNNSRFIDVEKMQLVPADKEAEYAALSYVWGKLDNENFQTKKKNIQHRCERLGLNDVETPKTISDAIDLTREMGIKYLWVDAICINQDADEKQAQIQTMDRIYGLASLIIVAATGDDGNAGLTGYHKSPRHNVTQYTETIQGLRMIISMPPLQNILNISKWNARGWTFQEWQLARRSLIFTNQQVYFVCSSASFSEDIALETIVPRKPFELLMDNVYASTTRHQLRSRFFWFSMNGGWIDYINLVEGFTPRELTYNSDVLLAISGLLNNLHRASRNRFLCGLSVGLIHEALFWVPIDGGDFRFCSEIGPVPPFPSWSWAGWKGAVKYQIFPGTERSLIEEWEVWTDAKIATLGKPLSEPQTDRNLVGISFFTESGFPTAVDEESESRRKGTGNLEPNHLAFCFLDFQAQVATLQLAPSVINDMSSRADALLDLPGRHLGVALLNRALKTVQIMENIGAEFRKYKCIAISVSSSKIPYMYLPAFTRLPEDTEWVNILLVAEYEGTYFRIGVGQVSKYGWDNWAEPKVERVRLG